MAPERVPPPVSTPPARPGSPRPAAPYPPGITYLDLIRVNKRRSAALMGVMVLLAAVLGAAIAAFFAANSGARDTPSLLPSAALGAGVAITLAALAALWSWFAGANAILAMSGAHEIQKHDDPELFNVVDEMRLAAGVPMPRVYIIDDSAMNAFATGRDPQHAAVAITTGLRASLTRDELQGVMAHEVAHVRHYDIRFALIMATMVGLIVFAADALRRMLFYSPRVASRGRGKNGGGALMIILLVLVLILSIIAPVLALLIQRAYSRQREYLADAGAVELTRNPQGLASALAKLARDPEPLVDTANRGTAHLFIVNPLRKMRQNAQALDSAWSSHPPVQLRIARLLALTR